MQEENRKSLGTRLLALRDHHMVTWGELAEIIGISRAMLDFVRNGRPAGPKVMRLITAAEQTAGLAPQPPAPEKPAPASSAPLRSSEIPDVGTPKPPDLQTLEARLERVEAMLAELLRLAKGKKR